MGKRKLNKIIAQILPSTPPRSLLIAARSSTDLNAPPGPTARAPPPPLRRTTKHYCATAVAIAPPPPPPPQGSSPGGAVGIPCDCETREAICISGIASPAVVVDESHAHVKAIHTASVGPLRAPPASPKATVQKKCRENGVVASGMLSCAARSPYLRASRGR